MTSQTLCHIHSSRVSSFIAQGFPRCTRYRIHSILHCQDSRRSVTLSSLGTRACLSFLCKGMKALHCRKQGVYGADIMVGIASVSWHILGLYIGGCGCPRAVVLGREMPWADLLRVEIV